MLKVFIYRVLLIASLFLLSTNTQVIASEQTESIVSTQQVSDKVNINLASNKELAVIKGIGTQKAQSIIDYREMNGDFVNIEELGKVKGIGKSTLQKITPFISL